MIETFRIFRLAFIFLVLAAGASTHAQSTRAAFRTPKVDADVREKMVALASSDPVTRASAACALGRMQRRAVAAIPSLVALLSDGTAIKPDQSCGQQEPFEDEEWQPRYPEVYEPSPGQAATQALMRSEEHTSELQSPDHL